jgi:hypothetical protein
MKIAHWAYFYANPESKPPFDIRIGITDDGALDELLCENCQHIPEGAERVMQMLTDLKMARSRRFYFIYPRFAVADDFETASIELAYLVKDQAERFGVGFERNISHPKPEDLVDPVVS